MEQDDRRGKTHGRLTVRRVVASLVVLVAMLLLSFAYLRYVRSATEGASSSITASLTTLLVALSIQMAALTYFLSSARLRRVNLERLSYVDDLTRLGNGRAYKRLLESLGRTGQPYALFYLDLDRFKAVNDNYGHEAGNQLLSVVADRIRGSVRPTDDAFRMGGDEFVVVTPGSFSVGDCTEIARRLTEAVGKPIVIQGMVMHAGVSVGFARSPEDGSDGSEVMAAADECMYRAKQRRHLLEERGSIEGALARLTSFDLSSASMGMASAFLVYRISEGGELLFANEAMLRLFGCATLEEFLALTRGTFSGTVLPEDREVVQQALRVQLDSYSHNFCFASYHIRTLDGAVRNVDHYGYLARDERFGRLVYVFLEEIGMQDAADPSLEPTGFSPGIIAMDGTDRLTGLPNRYYYEVHLPEAWGALVASGARPAVVFWNCENFKGYNLRHGYQGGDALLRGIAQALGEAFPGNLVCRFGEDHFVGLVAQEGLGERVEAVHRDVLDRHGVQLDAGIFLPAEDDLAVAHDKAKLACDSIKGDYGTCQRVYDDELGQAFRRRNHIVRSVGEAIRKGWVDVHYQPVQRLATGRLCGVEALARWHDPVFGTMSPGEFIPVLEDAHLINRLDWFVAEQVCAMLGAAIEAGRPVVPVSVNLSRIDFELTDPSTTLAVLLGRYDLPYRLVHVEVTESALSQNPEAVSRGIRRLRDMGIEVWMDDFGSGYSSFNLLKDHDFDMLKIDMEFMRTLDTSERSREIVAGIVGIARSIGIHTLAEGVETPSQRDFLARIGCERIQGYLFGRPMPVEELRARISDGQYVVGE